MLERKANTRFYCLRELRSFGVSASLLATFLNAIVCRALSFGGVCCGGNISKHERRKLDQIVTKGGQAVGISGQSIDKVYFRRVRHKLSTISNNSTHPLYSDFHSS